MIIKGKAANSGGGKLSAYLADYLNQEKNDRVEVLEIRGSQFPDLHRSFHAWEAEAQRGKTTKALWFAAISPTKGEFLTREQQIEAVNILERHLKLDGQPRAAVVHLKDGREHIHVVWSRIDRKTGKAKTDKASHRRNCDAAREMEKRFGLYRVPTPQFKNDPELKAKYTRKERREMSKSAPRSHDYGKAKRSKLDPVERKRVITGCWLTSDSGKALRLALQDEGYILAHGSKRDFVVVDKAGDIHSLARQIDGVLTRDVRTRLKDVDPASIPKAVHVQQQIRAAAREKRERIETVWTPRQSQAPPSPPTDPPVEQAGEKEKRDPLDPSNILADLTQQQSTFTKTDLERTVMKRLEASDAPYNNDDVDRTIKAVHNLPDFVALGTDRVGRSRFTSEDLLKTELLMRDTSDQLAASNAHPVRQALKDNAPTAAILGDEQKQAFNHVTNDKDIALVIGFAGTGKSTMLGAAREAWEAEGYRVRGASLSSMAAHALESGSQIRSRTLESTLWRIDNVAKQEQTLHSMRDSVTRIRGNTDKDKLQRARINASADRLAASIDATRLTPRDIVVLDEAAMVGSRQMTRLLTEVHKAGAKAVLVGDAEQLQAIDAGGAFRALTERHGALDITTVRRQKEEWAKQATRDFAQSYTDEALDAYKQRGFVQQRDTHAEAMKDMVAEWAKSRAEQPEKSQIMMAYLKADVAALNQEARKSYREEGRVQGEDTVIHTATGKKDFAIGDRLYFLKNNLGMGVMNGSLGTVEEITPVPYQKNQHIMSVSLDGGKRVEFSTADYAEFSHGYAATVHKAQGATVDRSYLLASRYMDRHSAYVGMSRHREEARLYYDKEEFRSYSSMVTKLSRDNRKDTTLDYLDRAEKAKQPEQFWSKLRNYVAPSAVYEQSARKRQRDEMLAAMKAKHQPQTEEQKRARLAEILSGRKPIQKELKKYRTM